ncbi:MULTISPECIES: hypothetical protein [unclassified Microcoleus]|uniref:hypothetical protein n=1 Tax=unclassified Microcoleus TaxID=2642155 RepID=UPI00312B7C95
MNNSDVTGFDITKRSPFLLKERSPSLFIHLAENSQPLTANLKVKKNLGYLILEILRQQRT